MSAEVLRQAAALMRETAEGMPTPMIPDDATFLLAVADLLESLAPVAQTEDDQRWGHGIATTGALAADRAYLRMREMSR